MVRIRPASLHGTGTVVANAGSDWGLAAESLAAKMGGETGAFGGDELGAALKQMYDTIGPKALQYFAETGFCLVETGTALHQLANAFVAIDEDNASKMRKPQDVITSLGDI